MDSPSQAIASICSRPSSSQDGWGRAAPEFVQDPGWGICTAGGCRGRREFAVEVDFLRGFQLLGAVGEGVRPAAWAPCRFARVASSPVLLTYECARLGVRMCRGSEWVYSAERHRAPVDRRRYSEFFGRSEPSVGP